MSDFDDRSGVVPSETPWGRWWQTMEDVTAEVVVPQGTRSKEVTCTIKPRHLNVTVKGLTVISGNFPKPVQPDDSIWTLEDGKILRVFLAKSNKTAADCWPSLLEGQYEANAFVRDQMQQKLTLERFQRENPGMDFSGAAITGNYQDGGPILPS